MPERGVLHDRIVGTGTGGKGLPPTSYHSTLAGAPPLGGWSPHENDLPDSNKAVELLAHAAFLA